MAFPYVFQENFGLGTKGAFDTETDTENQLDFPHFTELARFPWPNCTPFSGAYCARITLSGGTADAMLVEADTNIAANTTNYFSFNIWFSPTFTATANDTFNILELLASSTVEATFGARVVAATNVINLGIGETAPTSFGAAIERGKWYTVELVVDVDNAGSNDGAIDIYVTEEGRNAATSVYATQVGSLDQGAITDSNFGCQDHLATTTGVMLLDNFIQDDGRLFAARRFNTNMVLTQTAHAFVGPGKFTAALLSGAGTDNVLQVFDSVRANSDNAANMVLELKNTANNQRVDHTEEVSVQRGCYVVLTGTNPRANINICKASIHNAGVMRDHGLRVA